MKTRIAYWSCQIAGWGAYSAVGVAMVLKAGAPAFATLVGYTLFFLYSIALTDLVRRELRRRKWLDVLTAGVFGRLLLLAPILGAVQTFLVFGFDLLFEGRNGLVFRSPEYAFPTWTSVTFADCLWLLAYVALTSGRRYREKEVRLQLALREAELRALEAQINPHFLFNCLNSIRALVVENPPLAQELITRFASILRYNLNRDLNHTVPLAAELEVVNDYLALESVRLEDRLKIELAVEPEAGRAFIPPMLLQTLVENALKHGIAALPEGGELQVRARIEGDQLAVEVINTGQIEKPKPGATQVGLANTRERLRIIYGSRASLELRNRADGRVAATVLLPRTV